MPNTLNRFKQWRREWWVRDICAECPEELDLADWNLHASGCLVRSVICEYPTCTETTQHGVVITCVHEEHSESRRYCCELHAALALPEMARNEVMGYYTESKAIEHILQLASRSLDGVSR